MNLREQYPQWATFRVIREGARLSGWTPNGPAAHRGYSRDLHVGDVIVCLGFGAGFGSDPGYGIHWRDPDTGARTDFWPSTGGAFSYRPVDGYLEPVAEDDEE